MPRNRIRRETLSEKAYNSIKSLIVTNRIPSGHPISELSLCKRLGVSRTPIREALRQLEKENLITLYPRRGAFINQISFERIREIFQIREIIEGEVARLSSPNISEEELTKIENQILVIKSENESQIVIEDALKIGRSLHRLMFDRLGNKTLIQLMENLSFEIERGCNFASLRKEKLAKYLDQHLQIIKALKKKDGKTAKILVENHIKDAKASVVF